MGRPPLGARRSRATTIVVHTELPGTKGTAKYYEARAEQGLALQDDNNQADMSREAIAAAEARTDAYLGQGSHRLWPPTRPSDTRCTALHFVLGTVACVPGDFAGALCCAPRPGEVRRCSEDHGVISDVYTVLLSMNKVTTSHGAYGE